ncbi:MAG: hypothetical protein ABI599_11140 [Flavobacteriales bacterium]
MLNQVQRGLAAGFDMLFEGMSTLLWQAVAASFVTSVALFSVALRFVRNHLRDLVD